jgi:hypothetical protein
MKRSLVLLVLLLCTVALSAQPQQLPASGFRVTQTVPGPAANHRFDLHIVTNGQNFLAGWVDERTGWEARRLIVTRLSRDGNALDGPSGTGIALGEPWNIAEFSIASDGVDYLVVWRPIEGDVQLVRIDGTTGAVAQLPSIDFSQSMYELSLSWIGDRYVLVHRTAGHEYTEVEALELDRNGQSSQPIRTIISATESIRALRVIPFGSQELLAVWTEESGKTYASQIGTASEVATPVLVAQNGDISALASSGATVMAVLSSALSYEQPPQLTTVVLGANGSVVRGAEAAGETVSTPQRADVTWDGSRFRLLVIPNGAWAVRVATYEANGGLLEYPRVLTTSGEMYDVVTASAQGETLAVYSWRTSGSGVSLRLRAQKVAEGSSTARHISMSEPESGLPAVVWRGDHYLSVWLDQYGDRSEAKFMFVNPDGTQRGPGVTTFATSVHGEDDRLSVATDGDKALIVWYRRIDSNSNMVQALLVGDENTSAPTPITLVANTPVQSSPAVSWNGSEYLVVWASQEPRGLYGMRVAADGTKLDAQPVLFATERASHRPALTWNGTHWTVASMFAIPRDPDAEYLEFDLYNFAIQLTRDLTPTGPLMRLSIAEPTPPRIASRNGEVLVVWGTTVLSYEIDAARIVNGANLDGPTGFRIGAGTPTSVHATDSGYVILEQGGFGHKVENGRAAGSGKLFSFVPELATNDLVTGGPRPLVVYRAWPTGSEHVAQVWARYVTETGRRRAVRR